MKNLITVILSLSLLSCSSGKKHYEFNNRLTDGQCEDAYAHIPDNSAGLKFIRSTQEAAGTAFHYAVTGASYVAEYTLYVSTGILVLGVACAPAYYSPGSPCIPISGLPNPVGKMGQKTSKATEKWACSNIDPLSQQVRRVSACFKARNTPSDLEAAQKTLVNFRNSEEVYKCLSPKERELFKDDLKALEG